MNSTKFFYFLFYLHTTNSKTGSLLTISQRTQPRPTPICLTHSL